MSKGRNKGFTLIELMMVVIIIGILAAMVVPRFVGRVGQAKIGVARADIATISQGLEMYEMENGMFPTTEQGLKALLEKPTTSPVPQNWASPYLKKDPIDPWQKTYQYRCPSQNNQDFDLWSLGQDGRDGTDDDITNWKKPQ